MRVLPALTSPLYIIRTHITTLHVTIYFLYSYRVGSPFTPLEISETRATGYATPLSRPGAIQLVVPVLVITRKTQDIPVSV